MVAMMPHSATSRASVGDPKRTRTKSAGVTRPCEWATDHIRLSPTNAMGPATVAKATAKNPPAPTAKSSAGNAMKVYAVNSSPVSRNQVSTGPKLRPPSPHSSRL